MFVVGVVYSAGCHFCVELVEPAGNSIWDKFANELSRKLNTSIGKNKYTIVKVEAHNKNEHPRTAKVVADGVPAIFKYHDDNHIEYYPPQARTVESLLAWATADLPKSQQKHASKNHAAGGSRLGKRRNTKRKLAKRSSAKPKKCKTCRYAVDLFSWG